MNEKPKQTNEKSPKRKRTAIAGAAGAALAAGSIFLAPPFLKGGEDSHVAAAPKVTGEASSTPSPKASNSEAPAPKRFVKLLEGNVGEVNMSMEGVAELISGRTEANQAVQQVNGGYRKEVHVDMPAGSLDMSVTRSGSPEDQPTVQTLKGLSVSVTDPSTHKVTSGVTFTRSTEYTQGWNIHAQTENDTVDYNAATGEITQRDISGRQFSPAYTVDDLYKLYRYTSGWASEAMSATVTTPLNELQIPFASYDTQTPQPGEPVE